MSNEIAVYEIKPAEIDKAAKTLFEVFKEDTFMQWIFGSAENWHANGEAAMRTWVKYCMLYGKALRTENFESIALRKRPGDVKFSFWRGFRSGMLSTPKLLGKEGFERLMAFDEMANKAKQQHYGSKQYWYCWLIGTLPHKQRQGFGSALMQYTFDLAKRDGLSCCLETVHESSLQVHAKKGYEVFAELPLDDGNLCVRLMDKPFVGGAS